MKFLQVTINRFHLTFFLYPMKCFRNFYFIGLFTFILFASCSTEPQPPKIEPIPGYQQDIPWPSLADSPWPKFRHDAQGTNRSKYSGPSQGVIEWINEDFFNMSGEVTVGFNSELYLASQGYETGIYKLNGNSGSILWQYDSLGRVIDLHPCPIVLSDSTIIASSGSEGRILKLDFHGNFIWEYRADAEIYNRGIGIDKVGNIFFIDGDHSLYCIDPKGKELWKEHNELFGGYGVQSLVFSPDGSTLYFQGFGVAVVAFDILNKTIKWTFGNLSGRSFTMVDSQGNIYVLTQASEINSNHSLYSLSEDGSLRWYFEHGDKNVTEVGSGAPLCMDKEGNIYFATDSLFSLDFEGNVRFIKKIDNLSTLNSIIIDKDNNLFIWISGEIPTALALNNKGDKLWELTEGLDYTPKYFGALSDQGQWFVCSFQYINKLYSIK